VAAKLKRLHDAVVPGGTVQIYGGGSISLGMMGRFPQHPDHPTFHKIADYTGAPSLLL
jgi:hypothetical protein